MKLQSTSLLVGLISFAIGVSACGPGPVVVDASDSGGTIEWPGASLLEVRLDTNPSTGFRWIPDGLDASIVQTVGESEYERHSSMPGGAATQVLRFRALKEGQTQIRLEHRRSSESDVEPVDAFEVKVEITPPIRE